MANDMFPFFMGPVGRNIHVDASGRLIVTGDVAGGPLYAFGFGQYGRVCVVDSSGRLVVSPLSPGIGGGTVGPGTSGVVSKFDSSTTVGNSSINDNASGVYPLGKTFFEPIQRLTSATGVSVDLSLANEFRIILGHNVIFTFTKPRSGAKYTFIIKQDAVGTRTVTWPTAVKWRGSIPPVISTGNGAKDIVTMIFDDIDSTYDADIAQAFG